jgi:endonuclease III
MSTNRAALLTKLHKVLKKHYKPAAPPAGRTVLEHLLYACCLENSRQEAADEAFAKLKELYFDWNEVRVTTVAELAEVMTGIPDAPAAAQRLKKALQTVFETVYDWTLEHLAKQNIGKSEKDLEKIQGITPFVQSYVIQNGLGGHSIPVNSGAIEILYAVGAISDVEADKHQVPGMERAIPKNKGEEFGSLLHQIGADYHASPGSTKLRGILAEIDGDFKERIAKRTARQEAEAATAAANRQKERIARRVEAKAAQEQEAKERAAKAAAAKSGRSAAKQPRSQQPKPAPPAAKPVISKDTPKEVTKPKQDKPKSPPPLAKKIEVDVKKKGSKPLGKKKPR